MFSHQSVIHINIIFLSESCGTAIEGCILEVARPSTFVGTPSIFEFLRLKRIYIYCKTTKAHVLHID